MGRCRMRNGSWTFDRAVLANGFFHRFLVDRVGAVAGERDVVCGGGTGRLGADAALVRRCADQLNYTAFSDLRRAGVDLYRLNLLKDLKVAAPRVACTRMWWRCWHPRSIRPTRSIRTAVTPPVR
jgi:hypothetical protein